MATKRDNVLHESGPRYTSAQATSITTAKPQPLSTDSEMSRWDGETLQAYLENLRAQIKSEDQVLQYWEQMKAMAAKDQEILRATIAKLSDTRIEDQLHQPHHAASS